MSNDIWTWIAAILTLAIFSFLYKDNPLYKIAEYLFVGISAGYFVIIYWNNSIVPNLILPIWREHNFWFLIPGVLGILFFTRFIPRLSFLVLIPLSFYMGSASGMAIGPTIQARFIKQIQGTLLSPQDLTINFTILNKSIILVGIIGTMLYFFFSKEHKGIIKGLANIGIWFIMVGFGASFGYTVMARASLLIGRIQFLLGDWLHLIK